MSDSQPLSSWTVESSELISEYAMFSVRHDRARNPEDGSVRDFHIAESPDGVITVALTGDDELVMVEQYRHGTRRLSLELPAGIVDDGEDPTVAGLRELREETGFVAERGEILGELTLNPSWQSMRVHVLLVRELEGHQAKDLDVGENTRVHRLSQSRVRELVRQGEINSAVTISALLLLDLAG